MSTVEGSHDLALQMTSGRQTILLVDRESDFLGWASGQLKDVARVLTEESSDAAYKTFAMEQPDLVITEMNLHPFSGVELLARIRKHSPNAMVILTSAFGTTQNVIEAMKMGAFDFVRKEQLPFNLKIVADSALKAAADSVAASPRGEALRCLASERRVLRTKARMWACSACARKWS